jgi:hypothetical protein
MNTNNKQSAEQDSHHLTVLDNEEDWLIPDQYLLIDYETEVYYVKRFIFDALLYLNRVYDHPVNLLLKDKKKMLERRNRNTLVPPVKRFKLPCSASASGKGEEEKYVIVEVLHHSNAVDALLRSKDVRNITVEELRRAEGEDGGEEDRIITCLKREGKYERIITVEVKKKREIRIMRIHTKEWKTLWKEDKDDDDDDDDDEDKTLKEKLLQQLIERNNNTHSQ